MLTTIGMALGRLKGGLGLTVVVVGAMLAAATGVVAATVIVMGLLSLPTMVRYGYDHRLATGPDHGVGHPGPASPPLPGADPPCTGGGRLGRRPVPGSHGSGNHAGRHLRCVLPVPGVYQRRSGSRSPRRGSHHPGGGPDQGTPDRGGSDNPPDPGRARHDLQRDSHSHRGGCRRSGRRHGARSGQPEPEVAGHRRSEPVRSEHHRSGPDDPVLLHLLPADLRPVGRAAPRTGNPHGPSRRGSGAS